MLGSQQRYSCCHRRTPRVDVTGRDERKQESPGSYEPRLSCVGWQETAILILYLFGVFFGAELLVARSADFAEGFDFDTHVGVIAGFGRHWLTPRQPC